MTIEDGKAATRPRRRSKSGEPGESGAQATRRKLLHAATRLFSEFGYNAVSVRTIAQEAGVNAALVNYHYGTKEALFEEVIRINTADQVTDRLHRLTQAKRTGRELPLEEVLEIYVSPLIFGDEASSGAFARLHSVMVSERSDVFEDIASRAFASVNIAFVDELQRCLPHLPRNTVIWRLYALVGTLLFFDTRPAPPGILTVSGGNCDPSNRQELFRQVMPFLIQGMLAPAPTPA